MEERWRGPSTAHTMQHMRRLYHSNWEFASVTRNLEHVCWSVWTVHRTTRAAACSEFEFSTHHGKRTASRKPQPNLVGLGTVTSSGGRRSRYAAQWAPHGSTVRSQGRGHDSLARKCRTEATTRSPITTLAPNLTTRGRPHNRETPHTDTLRVARSDVVVIPETSGDAHKLAETARTPPPHLGGRSDVYQWDQQHKQCHRIPARVHGLREHVQHQL